MTTPLGMSVEGQTWALKALHPSDPVSDVVGVPDQTSLATTVMNYQQLSSVSAPISGKTWEMELHVFSDPTVFASVYGRCTDGSNSFYRIIHNTGLGVSVATAVAAWTAQAERWRCCYNGTTCYLNAPALSNQGSCVAAQHPVVPLHLGALTTSTQCTARQVVKFQANDLPAFDNCMALPNAYTGHARDGCYMPLRLDSNHAEWHTSNDQVTDASNWVATAVSQPIATTSVLTGGLYPGLAGLYVNTGSWFGSEHLLPCSSNCGTICFRGLSDTATLDFAFRTGYEIIVQPGSSYVPFVKMSPGFDPLAINNYYMISRRLKDAYPAEYNDLGKLWDVIKGAAKIVDPLLGMVPGGQYIRGAGRLVGSLVDGVRKKKAAQQQPSEVDLRAAQSSAEKSMRSKPRVVQTRTGAVRIGPRRA